NDVSAGCATPTGVWSSACAGRGVGGRNAGIELPSWAIKSRVLTRIVGSRIILKCAACGVPERSVLHVIRRFVVDREIRQSEAAADHRVMRQRGRKAETRSKVSQWRRNTRRRPALLNTRDG